MQTFYLYAFASKGLLGNPACVVILDEPLTSERMQDIAAGTGLPETGFILPHDASLSLRWFTPDIEMDLCGHCTLAAAHVAFSYINKKDTWFPSPDVVCFDTVEGKIRVKRISDGCYTLAFPIRAAVKDTLPNQIWNSLSIKPVEVFKSRDYLLLYSSVEDVVRCRVSDRSLFDSINIDPGGVILTSAVDVSYRSDTLSCSPDNEASESYRSIVRNGAPFSLDGFDFVSRFLTPQATILEDPVTGSAHCTLVPFWADRLSKTALRAIQLSHNGGALDCLMADDKVYLTGEVIETSADAIRM